MVPTPFLRLMEAERRRGGARGDHHHERVGPKSPYRPHVWGQLSKTSGPRCPSSHIGIGKGIDSNHWEWFAPEVFLTRRYEDTNRPWEKRIFVLGLATPPPLSCHVHDPRS